jgi:hypothetical protein
MNEQDELISKAFEDLAERTPRGAPPEIGVRLREAFRTHHARLRRRRLMVSTAAAAFGLCAAVAVLVLFRAGPSVSRPGAPENNRPGSAAPENNLAGSAVQPSPVPPNPEPNDRTISQAGGPATSTNHEAVGPVPSTNHEPRRLRRSSPAVAAGPFIPLPTYDPVVPTDGYEILRVQLRDTALSELGLPVREDASGRSVLADLLVDRDGIPLAVRFVGPRATR